MTLWTPRTRPELLRIAGLIRIMDADGILLREVEPIFAGPPCRMHKTRDCPKCMRDLAVGGGDIVRVPYEREKRAYVPTGKSRGRPRKEPA